MFAKSPVVSNGPPSPTGFSSGASSSYLPVGLAFSALRLPSVFLGGGSVARWLPCSSMVLLFRLAACFSCPRRRLCCSMASVLFGGSAVPACGVRASAPVRLALCWARRGGRILKGRIFRKQVG